MIRSTTRPSLNALSSIFPSITHDGAKSAISHSKYQKLVKLMPSDCTFDLMQLSIGPQQKPKIDFSLAQLFAMVGKGDLQV